MQRPAHDILAPPFPRPATWINVALLRMDQQRGRPVLVDFWDFCRPSSLRVLPYLAAWHERYAEAGLRVVSVHAGAFAPSLRDDEVAPAVERLGVTWPVLVDGVGSDLWTAYGNEGWPSRYLWDGEGRLAHAHHGEGGYEATERAVQALLGVKREPVAPVRVEDAPGAMLAPQTQDVAGPWPAPRALTIGFEAGRAWAVVEGDGALVVDGEREVEVGNPGAVELWGDGHHAEAELTIGSRGDVTVHALCFTPGLAPAA